MSSTMNRAAHTPVAFDPQWKPIMECAVVEVFEMMVGAKLTPQPVAEGEAPAGQVTGMVGMAGALCGMTNIRCSRDTGGKLAALMLGGDAASQSAMIADAVGELCNMVAGNFKAKIASLADQCVLSVPTVVTGEDYAMQTSEPTEGFNLKLDYEGVAIWVSLLIHT
jgi:chemotaxis protein CheX